MTQSIDTSRGGQLSLAERAAKALGKPIPAPAEKTCLLLDVSGSMAELAEPGVTKIDALRKIVSTLDAPVVYAFARTCKRVSRQEIPDPDGGTALHKAFAMVKSRFTRVVLITDGLPDDEDAALSEARSLSLEIIYVGPPPKPAFLDRLAGAARPGSSTHQASLASAGTRALAQQIRLLLGAPNA